MEVLRWVCTAALGLGVLSGCDDHSHDETEDGGHSHGEYTEACQAIIDACHDIDDGTDPEIVECHAEWAHDNNDAKCVSDGERCIGLCEAAGAGHGDGGEHDE